MRIVVSSPIPGDGIPLLQASGHDVVVLPPGRSAEDFFKAIATADGVLSLLSDPLGRNVLVGAPKLGVLANYAVGYNNIDLDAATELGIAVTNTPDVLTDATADLTMMLLLMAMRRARAAMAFLQEGRFTGWQPDLMLGYDLKGKNLGILGLGRIGSAVARRAEGFGLRILYHTRSGPKADVPYPYVSFEGLLRESDILSIHLPLTPATTHQIGAKELAMMKPGSVLLNTARGPVVDEKALSDALKCRHLFAIGYDVFEQEPRVHPELLPQVDAILLPHIGSATLETRSAMGVMAARSLLAGLSGERPPHTVNPGVFSVGSWRKRTTPSP